MGAITGSGDFSSLRELVQASRAELQRELPTSFGPAGEQKISEKLGQAAAKILTDGQIDQTEIDLLDELKLSGVSGSTALNEGVDRLKGQLGRLARFDRAVREATYSPASNQTHKAKLQRELESLRSESDGLKALLRNPPAPALAKALEAQLALNGKQIAFFESLIGRLDGSSRQYLAKHLLGEVGARSAQAAELGASLDADLNQASVVAGRLNGLEAQNRELASSARLVLAGLAAGPTRQLYQRLAETLESGQAPPGDSAELVTAALSEGTVSAEELRRLQLALSGAGETGGQIAALRGRIEQLSQIDALAAPAEGFEQDALPRDPQAAGEVLGFLRAQPGETATANSALSPAVKKIQTAEAKLRSNAAGLESRLTALQAQPPTPAGQRLIERIQGHLDQIHRALDASPLKADSFGQLKIEAAALGSPSLLNLSPAAAANLERHPELLQRYVATLAELKQSLPPERHAAAAQQLGAAVADLLSSGNAQAVTLLAGAHALPHGAAETFARKADVGFVAAEIQLRQANQSVLDTFESLQASPGLVLDLGQDAQGRPLRLSSDTLSELDYAGVLSQLGTSLGASSNEAARLLKGLLAYPGRPPGSLNLDLKDPARLASLREALTALREMGPAPAPAAGRNLAKDQKAQEAELKFVKSLGKLLELAANAKDSFKALSFDLVNKDFYKNFYTEGIKDKRISNITNRREAVNNLQKLFADKTSDQDRVKAGTDLTKTLYNFAKELNRMGSDRVEAFLSKIEDPERRARAKTLLSDVSANLKGIEYNLKLAEQGLAMVETPLNFLAAKKSVEALYFLMIQGGETPLAAGSSAKELMLSRDAAKFFESGQSIEVGGERREIAKIDKERGILTLKTPLSQAPAAGAAVTLQVSGWDIGIKSVEALANGLKTLESASKTPVSRVAVAAIKGAKDEYRIVTALRAVFNEILPPERVATLVKFLEENPERLKQIERLLGQGNMGKVTDKLADIAKWAAGHKEEIQQTVNVLQNGSAAEKAAVKAESKLPIIGTLAKLAMLTLDSKQTYDHYHGVGVDPNRSADREMLLAQDGVRLLSDVLNLIPGGESLSLMADAADIGLSVGRAIDGTESAKILREDGMLRLIDWCYGQTPSSFGFESQLNTAYQNGWISQSEFAVRSAVSGITQDQFDDDDAADLDRFRQQIAIDQDKGIISSGEAMLLRSSARIDAEGKYKGSLSWEDKQAISQQLASDFGSGRLSKVEYFLLLKGLGGTPYQGTGVFGATQNMAEPPTAADIEKARDELLAQIRSLPRDSAQAQLQFEKLGKVLLWIQDGPPGPAGIQVNYD